MARKINQISNALETCKETRVQSGRPKRVVDEWMATMEVWYKVVGQQPRKLVVEHVMKLILEVLDTVACLPQQQEQEQQQEQQQQQIGQEQE